MSALRLRPVDLLGESRCADVEDPAAIDRPVLASVQAEPCDGVLGGVDDQQLVDFVAGVEGELLPGVVVGGEDLNGDGGGRYPYRELWVAVDAEVGDAIIVFGAEVELGAHDESVGTGGRVEQDGKLLCDERMGDVGTRDHVVDAFPDLVVVVGAGATALLEEILQLRGRWVQYQCAHGRFKGSDVRPRLGCNARPACTARVHRRSSATTR